ncbi:MAG: ATP synthase F1 subunit gamma [Thermodesulfovibrionales bacterium]
MATLRDIKRRIKAVQNTRQITKAMKMVAAAKLRRVQSRMLEMRPYADKMNAVISSLARGAEREAHPLLTSRPREAVEVLVLTSDRGLCGAFNANILRAATKLVADLRAQGFEKVTISTIGKKARDYYKRREANIRKQWTGFSGKVSYGSAQEVARDLIDNYLAETLDEVHLVYNEFVNVVQQRVAVARLLPLAAPESAEGGLEPVDFIFEPSERELLERLLPKNVEIQIFRALLESQASEEAARMTAMENATKSANEMIDSLTLQYNKARQATITKELMDIVGGVEALKES